MEEYMESELSGIFRVKLATKIIVRGSPGTHFMDMSVNEAEFNCKSLPTINHERLIIKSQY